MSLAEPEALAARCGRISPAPTVAPDADARWYCCQTHPQAERWARDNLARSGYRAYLPLCTVLVRDRVIPTLRHEREVPLFGRYLFVSLGPDEPWTPVRYSPGIARLLGPEGQKPQPVPDAVLSTLQAGEALRRCVTPAGAQNASRWPPGAAVTLSGGAFAGQAAVVMLCRGKTAVVALPVFGQVRQVIVATALLAPRGAQDNYPV